VTYGNQSLRQLAAQTGLSKSNVHRLEQARDRRNRYPELWLWEMEAGHRWVIRRVVATLYTFGLKRGVGANTLSEFFYRLHLERHLGCSPSALPGPLVLFAPQRVPIAAVLRRPPKALRREVGMDVDAPHRG
jgi:hypothetical protein